MNAFEAMQEAFRRLQELGRVIERGEANWLTFRDHAAAQSWYQESLTAYLAVV